MSAVLLIAVPLVAAFLSILSKKVAPYVLMVVSFFTVVILGYLPLEVITIGGFSAPFGINLVLDTYSQMALYVVNILFFIVAVLNVCSYKKMSTILLVALAGLNGLLLTGDLFNLFVFLEVSGISAYLITTTNKKPLHTFHYLVAGTVGSSLYLLGLIILYNMTGTLNMATMGTILSIVNPVHVAFPFLLMFIGLGVEAKLLPFNGWIKGILGHSNTLSGPMIAGVFASASLFVFGRLLTEVFVVSDSLMLVFSLVIGFSILAGEAMAYSTNKGRQTLLFSSVAQAGIAVLVFSYGFTAFGVLFVALNGFSKVVLFTVMNRISEVYKSDDIETLRGVFTKNTVIGLGFTVSVLSVLGLPLFAGFVVKLGILSELFGAGNIVFPATILLSSVVEGVYFVKLLVVLWDSKVEAKEVSFHISVTYTIVIISLLLIGLGVYWTPFTDFVNSLSIFIQGGLF